MPKNLPKITLNGHPLWRKKRTFSTGSRGYYAWGQVEINGKRYQVICNLVEIGSKE